MLVESQNEADLGFRLSQSLRLKCRKKGHFCHLRKTSQWPLVVAYWIGGPVAHPGCALATCDVPDTEKSGCWWSCRN